ncbi:MAG: D-2-hydroxyacid dehydrogenase [Opitutales bacterium]|nr:D-2-hydroxyacid dehydrogenase [Opitutales bacterium]
MTKIVVLDGQPLNPGDLHWTEVEAMGETTIYERTAREDIVPRADGADCVFTNKTPLDRTTLEALSCLRFIGVLATGYNIVDVAAAKERGIVVTNVPAYGTASVAQHVFALLLELTQQVGHHAETVRSGRWMESLDFCYWDHPLIELEGLTMGIVGFGSIGKAVARLAQVFGMNVLIHSRRPPPELPADIRWVDVDTLFRESDVVSLHCPLTPETEGLVNAARLATMKPGAFIINTGRGPLVVEADLAEALNSGRIAGAGLDVLSVEPPKAGNPLLHARNCFITPHIAWATRAARARLMRIAAANLRAFLAGAPVNVVG